MPARCSDKNKNSQASDKNFVVFFITTRTFSDKIFAKNFTADNTPLLIKIKMMRWLCLNNKTED